MRIRSLFLKIVQLSSLFETECMDNAPAEVVLLMFAFMGR